MLKYHVNPKTGNAYQCAARIACPYGDLTRDHYETIELAQKGYEARMETAQEEYTKTSTALLEAQAASELLEKSLASLQRKASKWESDEKVPPLEEREKVWSSIDSTFEEIRKAHALERAAYQNHLMTLVDHEQYLTEEMLDNELSAPEQRVGKELRLAYGFTFNRKYSMKDTVDNRTLGRLADHLSAWSGQLSRNEATQLLKKWDEFPLDAQGGEKTSQTRYTDLAEQPLTRDQYLVALHQQHNPLLADRDFVVIDLETTRADPCLNEVIEIGITKVNSAGEVIYTKSELYDRQRPEVLAKLGTGIQEVHNISPEMVKGKRIFSDPAVQKELGEVINDPRVVIVAQNSSFEQAWLNEHLDGFWAANNRKSGAAYRSRAVNEKNSFHHQPTWDTRLSSSLLLHGTKNNNLESIVTAAGLSYGKDAHRALVDAENTQKAAWIHAIDLISQPTGKRYSNKED